MNRKFNFTIHFNLKAMKNLAFALLTLFLLLPSKSSADSFTTANLEQRNDCRPRNCPKPFGGCTKFFVYWGPVGETPTRIRVVVCCYLTANVINPVACFSSVHGKDAPLTGYVPISDSNDDDQAVCVKDRTTKTIALSQSETTEIEGKKYRIKSGNYDILENKNGERYLEVALEQLK